MVSPHSGKCLFFVPTYINFMMFLVHCNACLVYFTKYPPLCSVLADSKKSKARHWNCDWGDWGIKASTRTTDCSVVITVSPKVAWMSHFKRKSNNKYCILSSFVMFTAAWTDSTGRNQQLCDLISAFTVYNIVQCLWKMANSLEYRAMSSVLLLWNVTVQFDLCILKIHSFLLLYIYMCPCMFVQKRKQMSIFYICHCMS